MAAGRVFLFFTFIYQFIFLRRKSQTTLAEGINISIRSKRRLYEDNRFIYKLTLFKISTCYENLGYVQIRMG